MRCEAHFFVGVSWSDVKSERFWAVIYRVDNVDIFLKNEYHDYMYFI